MALSNRERFVRLFNGEEVDRVPFLDLFRPWPSTLARWKREGLREDATVATVREIIGFDGGRGVALPVTGFIWPEFERTHLRQDGEKVLYRSRWGGIEQNFADTEVMSVVVSGPVRDRKSWAAIRERLDPDTAGRFPDDWDAVVARARASGEPVHTGNHPIGFFGAPRELFGFEQLAMLFYDDPGLVHEVLDTLCDLWIAIYGKVLADIRLDWFMVWEDMCSRNGPLIGPSTFREFLLPRYKRLLSVLRGKGCVHVLVDSDGDERELVPLWLEGGVNIVFPWETQFGLDLLEVRRRFPRLGIMGGLNKAAVAHGRAAIDEELKKVPALLQQGLFLPSLDHGVAPDTSWDNYRYFYDRLRDLIWKHVPEPVGLERTVVGGR